MSYKTHYIAKVISSNFGKSDTVLLLIPLDLWSQNSPDLNPVD